MTLDQVVSGASNVLIAIIAARTLSTAGFGLFGVVFLVYMTLIGITRAMVSDLALIHPDESRERPGLAIGASFAVSTAAAAILALVAFGVRLWNATLGEAMLVLAACLPLLSLQDVGRYLGFATARTWLALVLDSIWLVAMVAAVAPLVALHSHSLPLVIAAWGGSGAVAGLAVLLWYDVRQIRGGLGWLRGKWGLAWRYLLIYGQNQGATLGMASEVGAISGASALGGIQGGVLLVRPFTTVHIATVTWGMGAVARSAGSAKRVWRQAVGTSGVTTAVAAANMAAMLLLPGALGRALLGASWHAAQPLLLPTGAGIVCMAVLAGPAAALAGLRELTTALTINTATTLVIVAAAGAGAVVDGAKGALWFVAASTSVIAIVWWIALARNLRAREASSTMRPIGLAALLVDAAAVPAPRAVSPAAILADTVGFPAELVAAPHPK
jgi:O-antigen/teichoic acid export membrane protein